MTDAELDAHVSGLGAPLSTDELIDAVEKLIADSKGSITERWTAGEKIARLIKRYRAQEVTEG